RLRASDEAGVVKRQEKNLFPVRDASRRTSFFGPSGGCESPPIRPLRLPRVARRFALGAALVEVRFDTSPLILMAPGGQVQPVAWRMGPTTSWRRGNVGDPYRLLPGGEETWAGFVVSYRT